MRHVRAEAERLGKVPKPTAPATEAASLVAEVNASSEAAFLDFPARARAETAPGVESPHEPKLARKISGRRHPTTRARRTP